MSGGGAEITDPDDTTTTAELAARVSGTRFADLSPRAVALAVDAITDTVGVGIAGLGEPVVRALGSALGIGSRDTDGGSLLLDGGTASPADAALYNGTAMHALDFDDVSHPALTHPTSHLLPALLAFLGDREPITGRELVTAYVVGLEVEGLLGRSVNPDLRRRGWHSTGVLGAVASAAASARLLQLDAAGVSAALSVAASLAGGLRVNFGTMVKPLHAGEAARAGVLSAQLAREGITGARDPLGGQFGFLDVFGAGAAVPLSGVKQFGEPWEIETEYGIAIKPYPSCGATHPAAEAATRLHADVGDRAIARVRVGVSERTRTSKLYSDPQNPLEAKFSIEYCVAVGLARGELTLGSFADEEIGDARVRDLIRRTEIVVDDRVAASTEWGSVVSVEYADGSRQEVRVDEAQGKPSRWLDESALRVKFLSCTEPRAGAGRAQTAFLALRGIVDADSVYPILRAAVREPATAVPAGGARRD